MSVCGSVALFYLLICLWSISLCTAQQTLAKESDTNDRAFRQLQLDFADLKEQMKAIVKQNSQLIDDNAICRKQNSTAGTPYIRWGRTECNQNASLVYSGYTAGSSYLHTGGTSELLCLPQDPEWRRPVEGLQSGSYIYGTEYETGYGYSGNDPFLKDNANGQSLYHHNVPCALCYVPGKSAVQLFPSKVTCPEGWTEEYHGFLMSQYHNRQRQKAVCVDEAPEVLAAGEANQNGALLYNIEARCGSLPCPNYIEGRELTCALCSR